MLTVDVPLNTMLADLDETLRGLLQGRARAARLRGRRHRVRRARARVVGPALQADGQPLPLRPARGGGAAHERVVARSSATGARSRAARRWSWSAPTRSPRGHRPSRTSTGCSRRCSRSSTPIPSCPQDALNGRLANGSQAVADQGPDRAGQGREVGLLERGRRPVQGVARLRRAALGRVRRHARARPGGPHADHPHAADRRPGARGARDAPLRRHGAATRRASRSPTSGSRSRTSAPGPSSAADGRFRFDRLPPGPPPAAGAHGGRPRGRRAARSPRRRASTW